jgi:GNAT superfamily N-acetyltransferase
MRTCSGRCARETSAGWCTATGVVYAEEYGWDETFEALVARIVADYVEHRGPQRENAWLAEVDGEPAGCVFCMRKDDTTAQLRILLVEPGARGMGICSRLVEECVSWCLWGGRTGWARCRRTGRH